MLRYLLAALVLLALVAARVEATPVSAICDPGGSPNAFGRNCAMISAVTLNATATITSGCVDLWMTSRLGVEYECSSVAGGVKYDVIWRSGSACDTDKLKDDFTVAVDSVSELKLQAPAIPSPMRYGQLAIVGKTGNSADTVCTAVGFLQGR